MIYPVFAMRDVYAGFGVPRIFVNEMVAKRDFKAQLNADGLMLDNAKDFSFYRIGDYDTDTGAITGTMPQILCEGVDVIGD